MSRKLTQAEHVAVIAKVNPNVEVLGEIINAKTKVLCRCLVCGYEWGVRPYNLKAGCGCPECKKVKISNARKLTHAEHVAAIKKANPGVEVLEEITGDKAKVLCRCRICGHEWGAKVYALKQKKGCPKCARKRIIKAHAKNHNYHLKKIEAANKNIEVLEKITKDAAKVLCRCKVCSHKWTASVNNLKQGYGCPKCAGRIVTHNERVAVIKKVNPYVEILEEIKSANKKVLCHCKVCGYKWDARPNNLKHGKGCPRCAKHGFKCYETGKLYVMVDDLNVPTIMKIGVSVDEDRRRKAVLNSAHRAGVFIPTLYVAKTWEGPTEIMQRIEGMMHENYAEWNINFPTKFDGYKEFFYYTPETAEVFDVIEETIHEIINDNKAA